MNRSARRCCVFLVVVSAQCGGAALEGIGYGNGATAPTRPGLVGIVFDNPALAKPVRVWTVAEPNAELFAPISRHDYSLALRGVLELPFDGAFEIRADADDGLRLRLNGETVIDGWARAGARIGRGHARRGERVSLELEYFKDGGAERLALQWRVADASAWRPIPAAAFSHSMQDREATETRFAALMRDYERVLVAAANPQPGRWPTLGIVQQGVRPLLRARFPGPADFACDAWMYEGELDLIDARDAGNGVLELRHRLPAPAHGVVVSVVRPEPQAIEVVARLEGAGDARPPLDLCWQLRRAPAFASFPEPYPKFASRCFIFTERGRTFLDYTGRRPTTRFPADDPVNQPPWVQNYLAAWTDTSPAGGFAWAGLSPDRFTVPIAGVVSRDDRFLAALASESATQISQVWIDCLHNNPAWTSGADPIWRVKIYLMANDPEELLRRVAADFPHIRKPPVP